MQSDDPAFLLVGTEVSAKFKGAFCEAKIKRFSKSVKCKVLLKEAPFSTVFVDHSQIQGILEVNQIVDVAIGKESLKGVIQHIKDNSTYTVVFNDGDERQLRRTQLCIKGAKHFDDSANLDTMPLYNPEAFSSPVVPDSAKGNRVKMKGGDDDSQGILKMADSTKNSNKRRQRLSEEEELPTKKSRNEEKLKKVVFEPGNVVAVYDEVSKKGVWVPAVVVSSKAFLTFAKGGVTLGKNEVPLRGFRDAKYFSAPGGCLMSLRSAPLKNLDSAYRSAFERANGFAEKGTFPMNWERNQIYGDEMLGIKGRRESSASVNESKRELEEKKKEKLKVTKNVVQNSSSSEYSEEDEEYGEERDQFTAQLYKFHEERGTPINRAPILGGKDIDMFRLYNLVQEHGGKKRVTENNKWKKIMCRLHLEGCPGANPRKVQNAYSRYLDHFSIFYKNLGISNWLASSTSTRSVRQIRLTDRDAEQLRRKRMAEKKKEKEKEKKKKEQKRESKDEDYSVKDKEFSKKQKMKLGRDEKKDKVSGYLKKEKVKEKLKKEEKEIKKEVESDGSSISDTRLEAAPTINEMEDIKELRAKQEEVDEQNEMKNDVEDSSVEHSGKKRKAVKVDSFRSETGDREKGDAVEKSKRRSKQVTALKKLHRKKICSESDATEDYSERLKRPSPSVTSSAPSTSAAADRLASASGSEDEGTQYVVRKSGKRKGSFRETSAVSTTSYSSDHTTEITGLSRGHDMKLKKKRKEKDGVRTVRATVFTRFYQGQNVTAHHLSRWYDARIQNVVQPSVEDFTDVLIEFEKRLSSSAGDLTDKNDGAHKDSAYVWLYNRLEELQKTVRCLVHYLGWNNRYDSWALPVDIKVAEKDQLDSEAVFRALVPEKICAETLDRAFLWRSNAVGPDVALDGLNCTEILVFNESRPHSAAHQEHSSSEFSEGQGSTGQTLLTSEKSIQKLSIDTASEKRAASEKLLSAATDIKTTSCTGIPSVSTTKHSNQSDVPNVVENSELPIKTIEEIPEVTVSVLLKEDLQASHVSGEEEEQSILEGVKHSSHDNCVSSKREGDIMSTNEAGNELTVSSSLISAFQEKQIKDSDAKNCSEEITSSKRKNRTHELKFTTENVNCEAYFFKKSSVLTNAPELVSEEFKEAVIEVPVKMNEFVSLNTCASKVKKVQRVVEDVKIECSPSNTPETATWNLNNEVEKEFLQVSFEKSKIFHPENFEIGAHEEFETPMSSPSELHSKQPSNLTSAANEFEPVTSESTDVNDDECASPKDSFHALKVRMLQKMEADMASDKVEKELGLEPIDEGLTGDALIYSLQARIQELKDMYHLVRAEQGHLDRRWRKTCEKRKQREREQRKKDEFAYHVSD